MENLYLYFKENSVLFTISKKCTFDFSAPISHGELERLNEAVVVSRVNEACTRLFHSHFHNASHFRKWIDLSEVGRRLRIICSITYTPIGFVLNRLECFQFPTYSFLRILSTWNKDFQCFFASHTKWNIRCLSYNHFRELIKKKKSEEKRVNKINRLSAIDTIGDQYYLS